MFRPLPVLTFLSIPALALLIWLGGWQFDRMQEKAEAIVIWELRRGGDRLDWQTSLCEADHDYSDREILPPDVIGDEFVRFHGRSASGDLGWRLMSPLALPDCFGATSGEHILVQTGFETFAGNTRSEPELLRFAAPPEQGVFDAANNIQTGEFFQYEPNQLSESLGGVSISTDIWLIETSDEMPQHLAGVPPGQHLGYAITWWGLAIGLFAIYLLMHVQAGRLRFTRR